MEASDFKSIYGPAALFANTAIDNSAVLVKYTYYGDADFNGVVNFDDYSRADAGFNSGRSGWVNGDFDGNGTVNFDDYSLIDLAFNTQTAALVREVPVHRRGQAMRLRQRERGLRASRRCSCDVARTRRGDENRPCRARPIFLTSCAVIQF